MFSLCIGILITWSPMDIDEGFQASLLQIYPVLLSTLLSINRHQLSLFDANFALIISSSPLTVYLVAASTCNLLGIKTGLYKRIKSHRLATSVVGAFVLVLWFTLDSILTLSDRAFIGSESCKGKTFGYWLAQFITFLVYSVTAPGYFLLAIPFLSVPPVFIIVCSRWVHREVREGMSRLGRQRGAMGSLRSVAVFVKCAWCVGISAGFSSQRDDMPSRYAIDHHHRWYFYLVFFYLDIGWAYKVINITFAASARGYALSYGQVWSSLCVIDSQILIGRPPVRCYLPSLPLPL